MHTNQESAVGILNGSTEQKTVISTARKVAPLLHSLPRRQRATKIIATLGPATDSHELLVQLLTAGVDVVRLNFSHGVAADHIGRAERVRSAASVLGREVAIMADLQGPKIRVGKFCDGKVELRSGQEFVLDAAFTSLGTAERVGLDYKELPKDVVVGDTLLLDDGLIELRVVAVVNEEVHTVVVAGGVLSNNKGINKVGGGLTAPALTPKDIDDIKTAMSIRCDYLAISFPKSAADMELARTLSDSAGAEFGHRAALIAKIERKEAIDNMESILAASDGIMVARGDLAVEVGNAAVPALQKWMISAARHLDKVVITATQMMESMIKHPVPTRAEVSDVANAVLDGTDAVMLSAETASGRYPVETVRQMAAVAVEAERAERYRVSEFHDACGERIDQAIAIGALFTAQRLGCKAILALTESGTTVMSMSRHLVKLPIYGLTTRVATQRKMLLYRNVIPMLAPEAATRDEALAAAGSLLKDKGVLRAGDIYAITCGELVGQPGGTNMLKVATCL